MGAPLHPIPPQARRIADRICQLPGAVAIDQLTVNEYACGVGISPHVGERPRCRSQASQPVCRRSPSPALHGSHAAHFLHRTCALLLALILLLPLPCRPETHSAFTGAIVSLSLGGPAVMVLRREGHESRAVFLPPRTLLVMAGEPALTWMLQPCQWFAPHSRLGSTCGSSAAASMST